MTPRVNLNEVGKPLFKWPVLLLHPTIPKPMWGLSPRNVLGKEWWDEQRKAAYKRNNYCCWACNAPRTERRLLEAHECYLIDYVNGTMEMKLIAALCPLCHGFIHMGYSVATQGTLGLGRIWAHGVKTLGLGGIVNREYPPELAFLEQTVKNHHAAQLNGHIAPPEKWRLIIDGKEYRPTYEPNVDPNE